MDNNRLYPFMLAAICGRGSGGSSVNQQSLKKGKVKKKKSEQDNQNMQQQQKEDDDMDDTSLSFFLLRECPIFPTRLSTWRLSGSYSQNELLESKPNQDEECNVANAQADMMVAAMMLY